MTKKSNNRKAWTWIPSLYFAEGLPYVAIVTLSVIMYKNLGMSNAHIAFYTSWLYLPWVIKPFWSPFVDIIKTKRYWITFTQLLIGAGFAGLAFCIPTSFYIQASLAFFWLLAFSSATHDIAADGFYLLSLNKDQQAFYVGIRSTFYRLATLFGQGVLVFLAGYLEKSTGNIPFAWSVTFLILSGIFLAFFIYHRYALPKEEKTGPEKESKGSFVLAEFWVTFKTFFAKKGAASAIFFMLTYRFSEAQLLKLIQPFMLDARETGGLGLDTQDVGTIYGIVGIAGLTVGGILGGIVASKGGLKKWLWPMMLSMLLTSITFVYLAYVQPENFWIISACVLIEQFGYGFGFTAYMLFLMQYSRGKYQTAHYAICTGFMALGMMLPGMWAGWLQEMLGYQHFFIWIMICSIVPVISATLIQVEE